MLDMFSDFVRSTHAYKGEHLSPSCLRNIPPLSPTVPLTLTFSRSNRIDLVASSESISSPILPRRSHPVQLPMIGALSLLRVSCDTSLRSSKVTVTIAAIRYPPEEGPVRFGPLE
ncbi:hypothetical protein EAG_08795 [Camponotus floridanus]|uniref:Uncharacterized protein n=1 Tax=Camponotus floridanus TaxID=104421 RepID=E2A4V7_CAMFO|nr:hypothetical protein EAG_08795 [Camponotus floridanus]